MALRNDDFRKLLSTPAPNRSGGPASLTVTPAPHDKGHGFTHKHPKTDQNQKKKKYRPPIKAPKEKTETDELYSESDARLHEIMSKYRDRAAERRKGEIDGQDIELRAKLASGLHAFRDEDESLTAADRREQEIRESKYLGGDIEHTHLVKGLDYSLLNKARNDIKSKKEVAEEEYDVEAAFQNPVSKGALLNKIAQSKFTRNICRILFEDLPSTKNEVFQRGRMAYVVELDEGQNDVPVTLLRSTFECAVDRSEQNINANNMLINKLSEVLSYLRSDGKKKRRDNVKETASASTNKKENIYDDVGEYRPSREATRSDHRDRNREKDRSSRSERRERNYFDDGRRNRDRDREYDRDHEVSRSDRERSRGDRDHRSDSSNKPSKSDKPVEHNPFPQTSVLGNLPEEPKPKKSKVDEEDAYGELFPNADMFYGGDSDEEEDYSKMDMGPKKGTVNRWDFDTQEAYEKYQSGREAMPKAAFQFGLKAGAGRKTRKSAIAQQERKLDRELQQINKIWDRKDGSENNIKY